MLAKISRKPSERRNILADHREVIGDAKLEDEQPACRAERQRERGRSVRDQASDRLLVLAVAGKPLFVYAAVVKHWRAEADFYGATVPMALSIRHCGYSASRRRRA